ncbi:AmmeMemoRadiSam system protein B [Sulfolobus sp. S-194]|uniref:AmmeMemoRadiSam system protein B n=1 Tax=Sulfolobus sp. S-194 TaxID=2512240 RepID=UPI0014371B32|nr:AmmeMemoRadiSam system protein B [Sulfolobus sp. S-194]QIW24858.1 AmmeMemoRadiSam system protein B [Sulfolobus sp. S-194]
MIRLPAVAGAFYEGEEDKLKKQIEWSFLHPLGPGKIPQVPSQKGKRNNLFFIVPHAGYIYSGPVAAHSYYYLASEGKPDVVIILGPNHTGLGSYVSLWPKGKWKTPLGEIEIDEQIAMDLVRESEVIDIDEKAHLYEHSIEVQVPFLQYFFDSKTKIVPIVIMMQTPEISEYLAEGITKIMQKYRDKDIIVIASSDMNHYEPHEKTIEKDNMAIEKIVNLDYKGLFNVVEEKDVTACGFGPMMTVLILAKKFNKKPYVLKHATSGDTFGDKSSVVGYLSVRFGD